MSDDDATDEERMERLALALDCMVPIASMERASMYAANPTAPTANEMIPSKAEREALVDVLVMADTLAAGGGAETARERERRAKSLAAVAKAIAILAWSPGGCRVFGRLWVPRGGMVIGEKLNSERTQAGER